VVQVLTKVYVGGLLIEKGQMLLKPEGSGVKTWYEPPGKYLEDDETLEMAVSKGFKADTGRACAVGDLAYVIESFKGDEERELGIYFFVASPSVQGRESLGHGLRLVLLEEMAGMDVRPSVLGGKVLADERRGLHGSATYLVNNWNE
jgi:ADP-ribose pyrophosphatase YjhB (NUDIX family)